MLQSLGALEQIFSIAMTSRQDDEQSKASDSADEINEDDTSVMADRAEEISSNSSSSVSVQEIPDVKEISPIGEKKLVKQNITVNDDDNDVVVVASSYSIINQRPSNSDVDIDFNIDDSQTKITIE